MSKRIIRLCNALYAGAVDTAKIFFVATVIAFLITSAPKPVLIFVITIYAFLVFAAYAKGE